LVPLHPIIMSILFHHYKELIQLFSEVEQMEEATTVINNSSRKKKKPPLRSKLIVSGQPETGIPSSYKGSIVQVLNKSNSHIYLDGS